MSRKKKDQTEEAKTRTKRRVKRRRNGGGNIVQTTNQTVVVKVEAPRRRKGKADAPAAAANPLMNPALRPIDVFRWGGGGGGSGSGGTVNNYYNPKAPTYGGYRIQNTAEGPRIDGSLNPNAVARSARQASSAGVQRQGQEGGPVTARNDVPLDAARNQLTASYNSTSTDLDSVIEEESVRRAAQQFRPSNVFNGVVPPTPPNTVARSARQASSAGVLEQDPTASMASGVAAPAPAETVDMRSEAPRQSSRPAPPAASAATMLSDREEPGQVLDDTVSQLLPPRPSPLSSPPRSESSTASNNFLPSQAGPSTQPRALVTTQDLLDDLLLEMNTMNLNAGPQEAPPPQPPAQDQDDVPPREFGPQLAPEDYDQLPVIVDPEPAARLPRAISFLRTPGRGVGTPPTSSFDNYTAGQLYEIGQTAHGRDAPFYRAAYRNWLMERNQLSVDMNAIDFNIRQLRAIHENDAPIVRLDQIPNLTASQREQYRRGQQEEARLQEEARPQLLFRQRGDPK